MLINLCYQIAKLDDVRRMYHSYGIGTNVRGKILDSENFANLMNDSQFAKSFPANAHRYSETTEGLSSEQTHQNIPHHLLGQQ